MCSGEVCDSTLSGARRNAIALCSQIVSRLSLPELPFPDPAGSGWSGCGPVWTYLR